jgi:hypothetical protein
METLKLLLDALFALGGIAAFAFLAWGGWLVFLHSRGFVAEGEGRFAHPTGTGRAGSSASEPPA